MTRVAMIHSLAVVTSTLVSCSPGESTSPGAGKKSGSESTSFKPLRCEVDSRISPRPDLDYVDIRRVLNGESVSVVEHGKPCSSSTGSACMAQLEALKSAREPVVCTGKRCPEVVYTLTTQGDHVSRVDRKAEMTKVLGTIDTPTEAWILAMNSTLVGPLVCEGQDVEARVSAYRQEGSEYVLRERWASKPCRPLEITETLYRVAPTGQITKASSRIFSVDPEGCFID